MAAEREREREREQLACLSKNFFLGGRCLAGLWSAAFLLLIAGSALGQQNLLGNPGFETGAYKTESSYGVGYWYGDPGAFVGVENGITPYQGQRMFRALDISHGQSSDVHQLVDLSSYHSWISLGTETASWSARINRIPGGPQTNTAFKLTLSAYDGSPSEFPNRTPLASTQQYFYADALADSWEFTKVDLSLPANTTWISTGMTWKAYNTPLVFDGHYVDDARATVTPEPATLSLLALGGLALLRRRWLAMISVKGVARAAVVAVLLLAAGAAQAITIDMVTVGDPGNVGELSGIRGAYPSIFRICGAVAYEYKIGKYEVTAGQYTAFLNAVAKTDTYGLYNTNMSDTSIGSGITRSGSSGSYDYSVASNFANRPVNYVSFWDSCRFANWLNNGQQGAGTTEYGAYSLNGYNGYEGWTIERSPDAKWAVTSEDEWYKAAYYKGGGTNAGYWDYPTSSDTAPGRDMADASGNNANFWTSSSTDPIDSGKWTTVAGEFQNSDSPYGTFDQGGNVMEWNDSLYFYDGSYAIRGLRGGSFDGMFINGYNTMSAEVRFIGYGAPTIEHSTFGFRVSAVPEPATLSLLALGGLAMLRRRGQK
ncbi:MAG: SUMF1/EgtB/PvdO family nonheme iron enzyme [Planctomycetota bacterium]|nr:SUMF1/EgtB/PvdO family nonheme iron enzyme [Planctomycetota bacterium]